MFGFEEVDSVERFRQVSLKFVILLLAIVLLILLSFIALPEDIVEHAWVWLSSISLLFFVMAAFIFAAQLFVENKHVFHILMATLFSVLVMTLILGAGSICFSLPPASSNSLGNLLVISLFMVVVWDTVAITWRWVKAGNKLVDIFYELSLVVHLQRYTLYMAGVIVLAGTVLISINEDLAGCSMLFKALAIGLLLVPYGLADHEKDAASRFAANPRNAQ